VLNPALAEPSDGEVERLLTLAPDLPVVVYRSQPATDARTMPMRRLTRRAILKEVRSPDRLLDQVALFLHWRVDDLSESQRRIIQDLHGGDAGLAGRTVLIVDDDIRNIFALTSILEQHHMIALAAETGQDAIAALERTPGIAAVLMDVMMPELDGLDTTRTIRLNPRFRELPIIAVTAKAMRGDRERCIEAGAWDYLSKPVDPDELLAMLRAWLVR
jgi:CheY-like chemotaxis protein